MNGHHDEDNLKLPAVRARSGPYHAGIGSSTSQLEWIAAGPNGNLWYDSFDGQVAANNRRRQPRATLGGTWQAEEKKS